MHATLPLLQDTDFPPLRRGALETLQVNMGHLCNQQCLHCHVNARPDRKEVMDRKTVGQVLDFLESGTVSALDITGGAPEMTPHFRLLVQEARHLGLNIIDRCNLTILEEPGYEEMAGFLAAQAVEITASLPCYLEENVNQQRGRGVFHRSIRALQRLNALGYGKEEGRLTLNLVYNPQGAVLPPSQATLESDYKRELGERYNVTFNRLFVLANMPIHRFGSTLISRGQFHDYMATLKAAYREENLERLMCRSTVSVDWQGYLYDCDFNQMLALPLGAGNGPRPHISQLRQLDLEHQPIVLGDHCYGCSAGQGSSCGGALEQRGR